MDTPIGTPTNVLPYISMAYVIGATLIFGYGIYLFLDNKKIKQMRSALEDHKER